MLFHFIDAVIVVAAIAAGIGRWIVRRIPSPRLWQPTAAHLICTAAAYWTIQRVLGFQLMTDA